MTLPTYRIKGWDTSGFEVAQNSRTRGPLKWVAIPTKHDGKGFRRLMRHKEGAAFFGCWCLIVQVAAKCPTRGVLADDDGPLSSGDLHLKTGAPDEVMARAMKFLHVEVGWLETVDVGSSPPVDTLQQSVADQQQSVAGCNKVLPTRQDVQDTTGQDTTEQNKTGRADDLPDRAGEIPLPPNLEASSAFKSSWSEWLAYRRERRQSMRGMTIEKQLAMLSRLGPDVSCEAIENSIRNGWSGLFEPKENGDGKHGGKGRQTVAEHNDDAFRQVFPGQQ